MIQKIKKQWVSFQAFVGMIQTEEPKKVVPMSVAVLLAMVVIATAIYGVDTGVMMIVEKII